MKKTTHKSQQENLDCKEHAGITTQEQDTKKNAKAQCDQNGEGGKRNAEEKLETESDKGKQ